MLQELTRQASAPPFVAEAVPAEVTLKRGGAGLSLAFAANDVRDLSARRLRHACRCAWCTRARIDGAFEDAAADISISSIEPFGVYALRLFFSDGHDRGIFPWIYLKSLTEAASAAPSPEAGGSPCPA